MFKKVVPTLTRLPPCPRTDFLAGKLQNAPPDHVNRNAKGNIGAIAWYKPVWPWHVRQRDKK
eukprot:2343986-Amphidinium_carterae.1